LVYIIQLRRDALFRYNTFLRIIFHCTTKRVQNYGLLIYNAQYTMKLHAIPLLYTYRYKNALKIQARIYIKHIITNMRFVLCNFARVKKMFKLR